MYIRTASSLSKRQLFTSSFSVCLAHIVSRRRLVRLHRLVRCPHLCPFSFALCIVRCPVGTPSLSLLPKRVDRPNPRFRLHRTRTRRVVWVRVERYNTGNAKNVKGDALYARYLVVAVTKYLAMASLSQ